MTLHIYSGFTLERVGSITLTMTDDGGGPTAVTLSTGSYCHEDISSIVSTHTQFSASVKTALDAGMGGAGTYTVSYDNSTMRYTISYSAGNFTLSFANNTAGILAAKVLGFTAPSGGASTFSGTNTYTGGHTPFYAISTSVGGMSNMSDEYEPDDVAWDAVTDDASAYGIAKTAVSKYYDFDIPFESKTKVFTYSATSSNSWTHQHLFEHARNFEPLYFLDGNYMGVFKLRAEGSAFKPQMVAADYDAEWTVPYRCRILGNLQ